jgi:hypothetical protein
VIDIDPMIGRNRKTLSLVTDWVSDEAYENSLYKYGLPRSVRHQINEPINNELTYSDVISYLQSKIKGKLNYLEIGVSVGKNFFQIAKSVQNATLTGFDIEEMNPILNKYFTRTGNILEEWDTIRSSKKKGKSSLAFYRFDHNDIRYISGDIWDENSWKILSKQKFNVIFSDACHTPEALLFEYSMLKRYDLIGHDEFILIWDDLGGSMTTAFLHIYEDMKGRCRLTSENITLNKYRGWLGQHEYKHLIGIIMKFTK